MDDRQTVKGVDLHVTYLLVGMLNNIHRMLCVQLITCYCHDVSKTVARFASDICLTLCSCYMPVTFTVTKFFVFGCFPL